MLAYHLIREEEHRLEGELPGAEVEEVLQRRPEQLHDHDVVLALVAAPLHLRDADAAVHQLVELRLDVQLRVLRLRAFQLDRDLLSGDDVLA